MPDPDPQSARLFEHPTLSTSLLGGVRQMQPDAWHRLVETFGPIVDCPVAFQKTVASEIEPRTWQAFWLTTLENGSPRECSGPSPRDVADAVREM